MQRMTWKVLIADDDPLVLALVTALLAEQPDFLVVGTALDADAAVAVASRTAPDLVLLDVSMPGGGGPAAARGIRDVLPSVRMVALSACDDVATVRGMLDAGVDRYMVKGGPSDELLAMLRSVMAEAEPDPVVEVEPGRRRFARGSIGVLAAMSDSGALVALAQAVSADPDLELVGLAQSAAHAGTLAARHRPAVALVDAGLDAGGGDRAAALIRQSSPGTSVIALWAGRDRSQLLRMIRSGARGHLARPGASAVASAIRDVAEGGVSLDPGLAAVLVEELVLRLDGRPQPTAPATALGERLDRAARGEGLVTLMQPIVDLRHRGVVGHEALTRFNLSPRQSPDVWFAEAAALGRGMDLEIAAATRAMAALPFLDPDAWLSINVSPAVIGTPEFGELLTEDVCDRIVLEMTEHAPVHDYDGLTRDLAPLRERGVRIAVDDAGAGFASLRHILLLRPDFIKLDISLCRGIGEDDARRAMARALVGFASETGSTVIAEGLESADDVAALRLLDVPLGQGYELGRPAPLVKIGVG
jgi:EAL domain-containing protein (putative c-di-GMP-specific phosphodiesterase class I)/DNA-binding NarL/FixJ family response regulator